MKSPAKDIVCKETFVGILAMSTQTNVEQYDVDVELALVWINISKKRIKRVKTNKYDVICYHLMKSVNDIPKVIITMLAIVDDFLSFDVWFKMMHDGFNGFLMA